jgi:hypothetical protein
MRLAGRHRELMQKTRELQRVLKAEKKNKSLDEDSLKKEIQRIGLPWDTTLRALWKFFCLPEDEMKWRSLTTLDWQAGDLVPYMICLEEEAEGSPIAPSTIKMAVTEGNKLLRARHSA